MNVFSNRVKVSYHKKRSNRERLLASLVLLAVVAVCGLAGQEDEQDRQQAASLFSHDHQRLIVASWAPMSEQENVFKQGEGAIAFGKAAVSSPVSFGGR